MMIITIVITMKIRATFHVLFLFLLEESVFPLGPHLLN